MSIATGTIHYKNHKGMPAVRTVYAAHDDGTVLYIGTTNNLYRRWLFHHRARWMPATTEITYFADLPVPDRWYPFTEYSLIRYYNPPLNGKHFNVRGRMGFPPVREYHVPALILSARRNETRWSVAEALWVIEQGIEIDRSISLQFVARMAEKEKVHATP